MRNDPPKRRRSLLLKWAHVSLVTQFPPTSSYSVHYWDPLRFGHVGVISLRHVAFVQVYLLSFRLFFFLPRFVLTELRFVQQDSMIRSLEPHYFAQGAFLDV